MYKILILSDSNRRFLEPVLTNNLADLLREMHHAKQSLIGTGTLLSRIVFEETFASECLAQARLLELNRYTYPLRERLVRQKNPNWLNLHPAKLPIPRTYTQVYTGGQYAG